MISLVNVEGAGAAGIHVAWGNPPVMCHNNVFHPLGSNYEGMPDPTGQDGNISADPRYVDFDAGTTACKAALLPSMPGREWAPQSTTWTSTAPGRPGHGEHRHGRPAFVVLGAYEFGGRPCAVIHRLASPMTAPCRGSCLLPRSHGPGEFHGGRRRGEFHRPHPSPPAAWSG